MTATIDDSNRAVTSCCSAVYGSDWVRLLLGDSFHPGGVELTERLGVLVDLGPTDRVLDVASGIGTSALHLAREFGCQVVGIEVNEANVSRATARARELGLTDRVTFQVGNAEGLSVDSATFDVVLCECSFCTFPNKPDAMAEFARVLRPVGRLAMSDVTRCAEVSPELDSVLAWVACLGDARPLDTYVGYIHAAHFGNVRYEQRSDALQSMVCDIRARLLGAELLSSLRKITLPTGSVGDAQRLARAAATAIDRNEFGYALIVADRYSSGLND